MELTSLEPRRKGLTQLYLDGGARPKLDTEVVLLARLQPGDVLSEEELQELVERSDARRAQEKALYLLEHRSPQQAGADGENRPHGCLPGGGPGRGGTTWRKSAWWTDRAFAETLRPGAVPAEALRRPACARSSPARALAGTSSTRCWSSTRTWTRPLGRNIALVLGAALSHLAGGREGPPPGGGGLAAAGVLLRAGAPPSWAGWIRNKREAGRQSGFFFVRMGKSLD